MTYALARERTIPKIQLTRQSRHAAKAAYRLPLHGGSGGGSGGLLAVGIALLALSALGYIIRPAPSISELAPARPYFNPPQTMRYRVGTEVSLSLTPEYIATRQPNNGASNKPAFISEEMTATLRATGATVQATTSERMGVRMDLPAVWRWRVIPTTTGTIVLEPTASAVLANSASGAAPYEVYRERVSLVVETRIWDRPIWFLYDNGSTVLGVLGFLVGSGVILKIIAYILGRRKAGRAGFAPE